MSIYLSGAVGRQPRALSDASAESEDHCRRIDADARRESAAPAMRAALVEAHRRMRERRRATARVRSSNPLFNAWIDRSLADLGLLTTDLETGPYPYAGIPWFSTPFGRDAIITSLQTLWLQPYLAAACCAFSPSIRRAKTRRFVTPQPGKIMHEMRKGEMAATGEVPFAMYYGGVDSTPLFIVLAGAYAERTGDLALIDELWPALERAAQWVAGRCDKNRFGLLDYQRESDGGLANQGWKDSHDSVFHADGRFPTARSRSSKCRRTRAPPSTRWRTSRSCAACTMQATQYSERAKKIRRMRRREVLDGRVRILRHRARWPRRTVPRDGVECGPLAGLRLPSRERGEAVVRALDSTLFHTGWGVRTLAASQARFNPMAYHNGSVWPHDNALCARGLCALRRSRRRRCGCCRRCSRRRSISTCACPSCSAVSRGGAANRLLPIRSRVCRKPGRRARRS